jgi:hypothetical protein
LPPYSSARIVPSELAAAALFACALCVAESLRINGNTAMATRVQAMAA